jgi:digeranylgeranylglycerophospholipid reductase
MERHDVVIIGAGPAGSCCAQKLAQAGLSVMVYDRRQELGVPVRCGEGISFATEQLIGKIPPRAIAQRIKGARLIAPDGSSIDIEYGENAGYVLERKIFDKWLAERAAAAGAKLQTGTLISELISSSRAVTGVRGQFLGGRFSTSAMLTIAATGAESPLPKQAGIDTTCKLSLIDTCLQYEMTGIELPDPHLIYLYFGNKIAPRGYCWLFPKGKARANVGVGILPGEKTPQYYLDQFIQNSPVLRDGSILEVNAGAVPVGGFLENVVANGFMVIGEAAHHVNPIHGGGIKEAIISGLLAADVAIKCLKKGDASQKALAEFNKVWWRKRGRKLRNVERVREVVERLNDDELNMLATCLNGEDYIELTRGNKLTVLAKILARKPRLIKLARHLWTKT